MNDQAIKRIRNSLNKNDRELIFDFIHCGDTQGDVIENSFDEIRKVSDKINIRVKKDRDHNESALIFRSNLIIKSEMSRKILETFLDIGYDTFTGESEKYKDLTQKISAPLFLKLYIAPYCPYCSGVIKDMAVLVLSNSNINIEIIDGLLYSGKAEKDLVKSAPTLIFNENFRWVGPVQVSDVIDVLTNAEAKDLSSRSIQTMIEAGKAKAVAELMLKEGIVFNSLYELLINEKWSIRLGAMVVAEEIGQGDEYMANQIAENLWNRFESVGDTVKGDIVYLIGEIGSANYIKKFKEIVRQAPRIDLMDALNDSIETLNNRFGR